MPTNSVTNTDTSRFSSVSYSVETPVYTGPLDLLLQLIERTELDITKVSLAKVTDQFLDYINVLSVLEADEVSSFLVIAAKLVQIKSEVLLPKPPSITEDEEDPGDALARQLRVYKRYKEIGEFLEQREISGLRTHIRIAAPPKAPRKFIPGEVDLDDLIQAAIIVFTNVDTREPLESVVSIPRVTIRERITSITRYLNRFGKGTFDSLFIENPTKIEVVVTFLAMLELIKRHFIVVNQAVLFGEIEIETTNVMLEENEEFELEFGE